MAIKIKLILKEATDKKSESSNQEDESYKDKEKLLRFLIKKGLINAQHINKVRDFLYNLNFGDADEETDNNKEVFLLFNDYIHKKGKSFGKGDFISLHKDDPDSLFKMSNDEKKIVYLIYFLEDKGIFEFSDNGDKLILISPKKYNSLLWYYKNK